MFLNQHRSEPPPVKPSMSTAIFNIPELVDQISDEITLQDRVHCCRVNKHWFSKFSPRVWKNVDLSRALREYDTQQTSQDRMGISASIQNHAHFIRSLTLPGLQGLMLLGSHCARLTALTVETGHDTDVDSAGINQLCALIRQNPRLRTLKLRILQHDQVDCLQALSLAICELDQLKEVSIRYSGPVVQNECNVAAATLHKILSACRNLIKVTFLAEGTKPENWPIPPSSHDNSQTKIQRLELLGWMDLESTIALAKRCPQLRWIGLPFGGMDKEGNAGIISILPACPELEAVDAENASFKESSNLAAFIAGIGRLTFMSLPETHWETGIEALKQHHAHSLESVRCSPGSLATNTELIYSLLSACTALRGFSSDAPIDVQSFSKQIWACPHLRTLELGIATTLSPYITAAPPDSFRNLDAMRHWMKLPQDMVVAKILEFHELEDLVVIGWTPPAAYGNVAFDAARAFEQLQRSTCLKSIVIHGERLVLKK